MGVYDYPNENDVQQTRAWTGFLVVAVSDIAIIAAAIVGIIFLCKDGGTLTAVLTGAFTAISALTSAYFGIRAATNTAQKAIQK